MTRPLATRRRFDDQTGEKLRRSKAEVLNANPSDPNHLDVALFVDKDDADFEPGSVVNVSYCGFSNSGALCKRDSPTTQFQHLIASPFN